MRATEFPAILWFPEPLRPIKTEQEGAFKKFRMDLCGSAARGERKQRGLASRGKGSRSEPAALGQGMKAGLPL